MKYFLNEDERKKTNSTCYHEFAKGEWDEDACVFWKNDSLNIHDDLLISLKLDTLLTSMIDDYTPVGVTKISKEQWEKIYIKAEKIGETYLKLLMKLLHG